MDPSISKIQSPLLSQIHSIETCLEQTRRELKEMENRLRALENFQSVDNHKFDRIEESLQDKFRALGLRVEEMQKSVRGVEVSISLENDRFNEAINKLNLKLNTLTTRIQTFGAIGVGAGTVIQLIQLLVDRK